VEYRTDTAGNVHAVIGKMSFPEASLQQNLEAFISTIEKARPQTAKGTYIKKITISGTMTPGIQIKYVPAAAAAEA
ncbi:MAG: 50S ribosomal protein L1, partial [Phycisphaeraceae bacterium]|nr:50S ribosomal protein L1 [Phycisphaeraceae bacterium]